MNRKAGMEERLRGMLRRALPRDFVSCSLEGRWSLGETKIVLSYIGQDASKVRGLSDLEEDAELSKGDIAELSMDMSFLAYKILSVHTEGRVPRVGNFRMQLLRPKSVVFEYDASNLADE